MPHGTLKFQIGFWALKPTTSTKDRQNLKNFRKAEIVVHTVVIRLSPHFFKSASRISPHSVGLKMRINIYESVYCDRVNPKSKIVICLLPSIFSREIFETACWMIFFTENMLLSISSIEYSTIGLSPQHSDKSALGRPDQGADLTEWLLYIDIQNLKGTFKKWG
jgi:hypothetical protein